jgi:hypothetical protein
MIIQVYSRIHQHSATAQQSSQSVRRLALNVDRTIPTRVKSPGDIASINPVGLYRHRARRRFEVPGIQTHHWQTGLCQAIVDCR